MLIRGLNKFRKPYINMFHDQISLSGLPFPTLSKLVGELAEITAGITLVALVILSKTLPPFLTDTGFYLANLLIVFIMSVAVFVHLHPDVPAAILPFGYKPAVSMVITLFLALLNMYLHLDYRILMAH